MPEVHILICDESPDFAKSMGFLIMDFLGNESAVIEYAYNIQDGLKLANEIKFQFIFTRANLTDEDNFEIKLLFAQNSINQSVEIIAVSLSTELSMKTLFDEREASKSFNQVIDASELAAVFGALKLK